MRRTAAICGVLLIAGLIGVLCHGASKSSNANVEAPPADTTPKPDGVKQFGGKYLVVHTKCKPDEGNAYFALADAELKELRGHVFLVGKIVAPTDNWKRWAGQTIWVSMDYICEVWDVNDLDKLKETFVDDDQSTPSAHPLVKEERYLNFNSPSASDPHLLDGKDPFTPLQGGANAK